jgi:hypothetical protein
MGIVVRMVEDGLPRLGIQPVKGKREGRGGMPTAHRPRPAMALIPSSHTRTGVVESHGLTAREAEM